MVTCDDDFLRLSAAGTHHAGIVFWTGRTDDVGGLLRWLWLAAEVLEPEDIAGRIEYLP